MEVAKWSLWQVRRLYFLPHSLYFVKLSHNPKTDQDYSFDISKSSKSWHMINELFSDKCIITIRDKVGCSIFVHAQSFSPIWLFAVPWTVSHHAPLFMEFSRQEYWSGLPFPMPGDLPDLGMEPMSPAFPTLAGRFFTTELSGKPFCSIYLLLMIVLT